MKTLYGVNYCEISWNIMKTTKACCAGWCWPLGNCSFLGCWQVCQWKYARIAENKLQIGSYWLFKLRRELLITALTQARQDTLATALTEVAHSSPSYDLVFILIFSDSVFTVVLNLINCFLGQARPPEGCPHWGQAQPARHCSPGHHLHLPQHWAKYYNEDIFAPGGWGADPWRCPDSQSAEPSEGCFAGELKWGCLAGHFWLWVLFK